MIARKIRIVGQVQGVGYRDALCYEADRRGVAGWVRNRADGSVEAFLQGSPEDVALVIAWARRGPPAARVDDVQIEPAEDAPGHARFERRPSV
jgi:acylphosphatase